MIPKCGDLAGKMLSEVAGYTRHRTCIRAKADPRNFSQDSSTIDATHCDILCENISRPETSVVVTGLAEGKVALAEALGGLEVVRDSLRPSTPPSKDLIAIWVKAVGDRREKWVSGNATGLRDSIGW